MDVMESRSDRNVEGKMEVWCIQCTVSGEGHVCCNVINIIILYSFDFMQVAICAILTVIDWRNMVGCI